MYLQVLRVQWFQWGPNACHTVLRVQWGPNACQTSPDQRYVNVSVVHYTYQQVYFKNGTKAPSKDEAFFHFNKRDWKTSYPPLPYAMPPEGAIDSIKAVIQGINEAGMSPELWDWWQAHVHV